MGRAQERPPPHRPHLSRTVRTPARATHPPRGGLAVQGAHTTAPPQQTPPQDRNSINRRLREALISRCPTRRNVRAACERSILRNRPEFAKASGSAAPQRKA